jgi:DNA polymerase III sliding clamp (beta) subunit (PCNA family)
MPAALVDAARLKRIASAATGVVEIDHDGTAMRISSPNGQWDLPVHPPEEMPRMETPPGPGLTVTGLPRACAVAQSASAPNAERYVLAGVHIEARDGCVHAAGTDTYRLHVASATTDGSADEPEAACVMVAQGAAAISRMRSDELELRIAPGTAWVSDGATTMTCAQIEGPFPAWRNVIPEGHPTIIPVDPSALADAIEAAGICADDQTRAAALALSPSNLTITAADGAGAHARADVPLAGEAEIAEDAPEVRASYHAAYLRDIARAFQDEDVIHLQLAGPQDPLMVRTDSATCVLSPLYRAEDR